MESLSNLDTQSKRRSLPPLQPLSEDDISKKNSGPPRKTKKKRADLSDSKTSAGDETALSEDVRGHDEDEAEVKTRRQKRQSYPSMDQDELDADPAEENPSLDRRGKSPASRKKKRVPRSVSNEVLEDSLPTNGHLTARSRKSKNKTPRDNIDADGSPLKQTKRPTTGGKGKRKKKSRPLLSGDENYLADVETQSVDLMVSKEDIIAEETKTEPQTANSVSILPSQPVGRIFMERKSDFTSEDKTRLAKRREQELQAQIDVPQEMKVTTTQTALLTHRAFLSCSLFCHGLLAGVALWQCVVVFVLSSPLPNSESWTVQFLTQYSRLALSTSSIFYLLLAICTVSVFDRFDVGRPDRQFFRGLVTFQNGAISTIVYLICLVFSVSITAIDDMIGLYHQTEVKYCDNCKESDSLWNDEEAAIGRLTTWKVINVIRAVGAILGWLIVTLNPQTDYTSDHLHDAEEPLWEEQEISEMTNMASMNI